MIAAGFKVRVDDIVFKNENLYDKDKNRKIISFDEAISLANQEGIFYLPMDGIKPPIFPGMKKLVRVDRIYLCLWLPDSRSRS